MGVMGSTIAISVTNSRNEVHWTSEGRSQKTLDNGRAMVGSIEHVSISSLIASSDVIICIGRFDVGIETITAAAQYGFKGIYVDGNDLHGKASEQKIEDVARSANIDYVEALFRGYPIEYNQGGGQDKRDLYLSGKTESTKLIESLFCDGIWKVHIHSESAKELNRTLFNRLF
jgi:hypothetical protein